MKLSAKLHQAWINRHIVLGKPHLIPQILSGIIQARLLGKNVLRYLELQINTECNQRCKSCFASRSVKHGEAPLSLEEIKALYQQLKPMGVFQGNITGGEPLLHAQLFDILEALEAKRNMFAITTNGLLLTRDFVRDLKQAGLVYLAVSLNSLDAADNDEQRGTPGHFDQVMRVIDWAKEANLSIGLSTIFSHLNIPEFEKMARFAQEKGIQICPAFAVSQGRWAGNDDVRLKPNDYDELSRINDKYPALRAELDTNLSGKRTCPGITEKVFVTVYGDVTSCQLNPVSFGNIRDESMDVILRRMRKIKSFTKTAPFASCPPTKSTSTTTSFPRPIPRSCPFPSKTTRP